MQETRAYVNTCHLVDALAAVDILTRDLAEAVMSAAIGEAVVSAFRGEEVSDFMQSFGPVMEAQNIGYTVRLLEGDRDALWRVVKDACGWLRVTDDDEKDWPKLPAYAKRIIEERDEARAALAEAEAAGWRRGMEEAAKVCDAQIPNAVELEHRNLGLPEPASCRELARRIRKRLTAMRHADAKVAP